MINNQRPKHLALHLIELPLSGFVSILHRITGLLLFLALPFLLLMLQYSLHSIESYTQLQSLLSHPISKLILLGILWAALHHFCAGLRYLAIDLQLVCNLEQARFSSRLVMATSLLLIFLLGVKLW